MATTVPIYPPKATHKYDCIWLKCHETDSSTNLVDSGDLAATNPGNSVLNDMLIRGTTTNIWDSYTNGIRGNLTTGNYAYQQGGNVETFFNLTSFTGCMIVSCWFFVSGTGSEIIFTTGSPFNGGSNTDGCVVLRRSLTGAFQFGVLGVGITTAASSQPIVASTGLHHIMYVCDFSDWDNGCVVTGYLDGFHVSSGTSNQLAGATTSTIGTGPPNSENFSFGQRFDSWPPVDATQTFGKIDGVNTCRSLYIAKVPQDEFDLVQFSVMANNFYRAQGNIPRALTT